MAVITENRRGHVAEIERERLDGNIQLGERALHDGRDIGFDAAEADIGDKADAVGALPADRNEMAGSGRLKGSLARWPDMASRKSAISPTERAIGPGPTSG